MSADPARPLELVVVVPVRDRADSVRRAVESILVQAPPEVGVVVVDDGSHIALGAESFGDGRVSVVRTEGVGAASARNRGVLETEGVTWVTFLDSDDEAKPGWIDAMLNSHRNGSALFSCGAEYRWAHGEVVLVRPKALWPGAGSPRGLFLAGTFSVRRDLLTASGGYRDGLRHSENTDLGWRLTDELRRVDAAATWTDEYLVVVNAVRKRVPPAVLLESAGLILQDPPDALLNNRSELADLNAVAGVSASRLGQRRVAVRLMWAAVRSQPTRVRGWARLVKAAIWRWSPSA